MTSLAKYQEWKQSRNDVGCMFARYMARHPTQFGQRAEVVDATTPADTAADVASRIGRYVADPDTTVVTLVFPKLTNLPSIVDMTRALGRFPDWGVTMTELKNTPAGDVLAFGLTRQIPFADSTCSSEVLVLGEFPEFPATRRAPITALEIFVGLPFPKDPKTGEPTKKANLAHANVSLPTPQSLANMWDLSIRGRRDSLGCGSDCDPVCHDLRAKAKVAFVIPMTLATALGLP